MVESDVVELDKKDRKIMTALTENARISYSALAKCAGLSVNAVKYRIAQLKSKGVLIGYFPTVNFQKLGFDVFGVFLKAELSNRKTFTNYLTKNQYTEWVCELFGEWDYYFEVSCKSTLDFDKAISEIVDTLGTAFVKYETIIITKVIKVKPLLPELSETIDERYNAHWPEPNLKPISIDAIDKKLITALCDDGRASYLELASKVGVTVQTIHSRLRRLFSETVIKSIHPFMSYVKLGYTKYILLMDINYGRKSDSHRLISALQASDQVKVLFRDIQTNRLFAYVCIKHPRSLERVVGKLKEEFKGVLGRVEIMHVMNEPKIHLFPQILHRM